MAVDVERWLASKGLSRYLENFIDNGFDDLDSVQNLDCEDLDAIGVADSAHRDVLLGRTAPLVAANPPRTSAAARGSGPETFEKKKQSFTMEADPFDQFEAIFQDIDDMIVGMTSLQTTEDVANGFDSQSDHSTHSSASKEMTSVPRQATFELETSDQQDPELSLELEFNPTPHTEEAEENSIASQGSSTVVLGASDKRVSNQDNIDLDSILDDLMSFDPSKAVAQAQQQRVAPVQNGHVAHQMSPPPPSQQSQPHPPPSQPVAVPSSTGAPPADSFQLPGSLNEEKSKPALSRKLSTVNRMNVLPQGASTEEGKTVLIRTSTSTLHSASQQMSDSDIKQRLDNFVSKLERDASLNEEEKDLKVKEEKMRIALEKMKLANKKKVVIKVFTEDGASKAVVVDEDMTAAMVSHLLAVKNHWEEGPYWQLVERLGDLSAERVLEDHENVVDVHNSWPRDNKNVFMFKQNKKKYELMEHPLNFFPELGSTAADVDPKKKAERAKKIMMQEYFSESGRVPEVEGVLYMKEALKKPWKKYFFMLRASGLYHSSKGKSKAMKHLVKFVTFDDHDLYSGVNFKSLLNAPSQYCFCLKPSRSTAATKDVKVFCAENAHLLKMWMAGIRMAKYGIELYNDYRSAFVTQFKLEETDPADMCQRMTKSPSEVGSPPMNAAALESPVSSPPTTSSVANRTPAPRPQPLAAVLPALPEQPKAAVDRPMPEQPVQHHRPQPLPPVRHQVPEQPKPVVERPPPEQPIQHVVLNRPPPSPSAPQPVAAIPAVEPPLRRHSPSPNPPNPPVPTAQQHQPSLRTAPPPTAPKPKPGAMSPENRKKPPPPPQRGDSHLSPVKTLPDSTPVLPPQMNGNASTESVRSGSGSPPRGAHEASPPSRSTGGPRIVPTPKPKPQPPTPAPRPQALPPSIPPAMKEPQPYVQPVPSTVPEQAAPPQPRPKPKPKITPSGQGVRVLSSNNMATSPTASTPLLVTDGAPVQDQPVQQLSKSPSSQQFDPAPPSARVPPEIPRPYKPSKSQQELSLQSGSSFQGTPPATPPRRHVPVEPPSRPMFTPQNQPTFQPPRPTESFSSEPPSLPPAGYHHPPPPNTNHQQVLGATQREWFHGKITRDEAQKRINSLGQHNGVFLVRESTTVSGCYVLTMYAYGTFRNFQIQKVQVGMGAEKFFIDDGPQFPSLELLIAHYHSDADRMPCALTRFVPRSQYNMV